MLLARVPPCAAHAKNNLAIDIFPDIVPSLDFLDDPNAARRNAERTSGGLVTSQSDLQTCHPNLENEISRPGSSEDHEQRNSKGHLPQRGRKSLPWQSAKE
jgi:hypothetical protein